MVEAKANDTKKIRGNGQGQPFRKQTVWRPRTEMLEAKAFKMCPRGQGCLEAPLLSTPSALVKLLWKSIRKQNLCGQLLIFYQLIFS